MFEATDPYRRFIEHSDLDVNTALAFLEDIRQAHPNKYVIAVDGPQIDLLGYAEAGLASVTSVSKPHLCAKGLRYRAPPTRLSDEPGKVVDRYMFEKHDYCHEETSFIIYDVSWPRLVGCDDHRYFVVADIDTADPKARPPALENLLKKAGQWTEDFHDEIFVFQGGRWKKDRKMWNSVKKSSWDDVIIDQETKQDLIDDVQGFFNSRALYQEYSVPWKRGIILHGQPGNGKTISIRAILASLAGRDFPIPGLYVKSFNDKDKGSEAAIDAIFDRARSVSPCALILEDVDSMVNDEVRSYFLNQLDGLDSNDGILIIGSTNDLEKLDPALSKRPSRFDRKYFFKLPENDQRKAYAAYWGEKLQKNPKVQFSDAVAQYIADATDGFSFAYLKELFVVCLLIMAGQRGRRQAATEEEKEAATGGETGEASAPRLPDELTENLLAKLVQRQSKILHGEMAAAEAATLAAEKAREERRKEREEKKKEREEARAK